MGGLPCCEKRSKDEEVTPRHEGSTAPLPVGSEDPAGGKKAAEEPAGGKKEAEKVLTETEAEAHALLVSHPKASSASAIFMPPTPTKMFPPTVPATSSPSDTRYCIPLEDLQDASTSEVGWFKIRGMKGEPIFHTEVNVKPTGLTHGRVLEVSKVYSPGNYEILASVVSADTALPSSRPSGASTLPPQVLEVSLQEGRPHANIESWGSGSYAIVRGGQKVYTVSGDSSTLALAVVSVPTGQAAARIERRGVNFEGTECLELVINPSHYDSRVFILACVLAISTLRSWPTQSQEEVLAGSEALKAASAIAKEKAPEEAKRVAREAQEALEKDKALAQEALEKDKKALKKEPEKRIDPSDKNSYTYQEFVEHYKAESYTASQIDAWWRQCKPAQAAKGRAGKAKAKGKR